MSSTPRKPSATPAPPDADKPEPGAPAQRREAHSDTLSPYLRGDPIPRADAVEMNTDTTWALWSDLVAAENRGYAPTVPAPLESVAQLPLPVRRELSVVEVMAEARRNNRVCPKPARWQQLYEMLPERRRTVVGWQPAQPPLEGAWDVTPSITKRVFFREHIEWAATHSCLQKVFAFMKSLPEDEWHHMGE
ncbi:MAG: hypothetical protein JWQ13_2121 [Ramlibacter sp.]|jgi:hypothetical protein|uniref:hypothetical protein n=1 Tax=Ramlibacter sp. TaxID=1917967 RepID=UPI00260213DD|nr:hypothetical protein [Ramlibacter sp.]MDB5749616.1 hypothetical protein [Ramlibacter sp.]MDB5942555.1 hypothetical protein [Ramlibacter sp.]